MVVATKVRASEAAQIDAARGRLSRSEYLRWLLLEARKGNIPQSPG